MHPSSRLTETPQILSLPRPVMAEGTAPDLGMIGDAFRPQQVGEVAVRLRQRVVLARGNDPLHPCKPARRFAVHVRNICSRTVKIAGVIPVAVKKTVNIVEAGETDRAADDVRMPAGEVCRLISADTRPVDYEIAPLSPGERVREHLVPPIRIVPSVTPGPTTPTAMPRYP